MEILNSTHDFVPQPRHSIEANGKRPNFCDLNPFICGFDTGCHPINDTFICLCEDFFPVEPDNTCNRPSKSETSNSTSETNLTDFRQLLRPTESSFYIHEVRNEITNSENANHSELNLLSNDTIYQTSIKNTPVTIEGFLIFLIVLTVVSLVVVLVFYVLYKRNKARTASWLPCVQFRTSAEVSLRKCMQQYITNPNYYTNSPDSPLKFLQHLNIAAEKVQLQEEIGEGMFGKVHKGLYSTQSGAVIPVAVKTLKENSNPDVQAEFEREVEIMSSFSHENILKLLGVLHRENQATPWMVFEFMRHGDLAQLLRSHCPLLRRETTIRLTQPDLVWISTQIASGMVYLSSQHFVHRDLATRNCLVGDRLVVKISDFGMSRDIYTSDYYKVGGARMLPIRWMAPESISFGKFSLESDAWAYGIVLWEIFTYGKQPYYGHSNEEVVKLILQGILLSPPENSPPFICNIMAGCWKTEPRDRISFVDIFSQLLPYTPNRSEDQDDDLMMDSENYLLPTDGMV